MSSVATESSGCPSAVPSPTPAPCRKVCGARRGYWECSVNQASTDALFSFTQLMLDLVFSSACSRARVPDPKPMSWLSALNCSSCGGTEGLELVQGPPWRASSPPMGLGSSGQRLLGPPATQGAEAAAPSPGLQGAAGRRWTRPWGAWGAATQTHRPCRGTASPAAAQTLWRTAGSRIGSAWRRRRSHPRTWESREGSSAGGCGLHKQGEGTEPPAREHSQPTDAPSPSALPQPPCGAHWLKRSFQLLRMKSQARDCPTTLLAMLLMVEVASCLRILVGSMVYSRYLGGGSHRVRGCASRALALAPAPAPTAGGSRAQCCRREPRGSCQPRTRQGPPGTFPTRSSRPPDRPWPPRCSRWQSAGSGGCCRGKRRLRQGALAVPSPAVGAPQGLTCCCRCSASVGRDWWPAPGTQVCRRSRLC